MTTVAGIDYSTKAVHAAIVADAQLRFVKQYALGNHVTLGVIQQMTRDLLERGVERVWLETPFFIPARIDKVTKKLRQGSNVNTLKLHRVANQVETIATLAGLRVEYVAPATWKSVILTGVPAASTKARSIWFVSRVFNLQTRDDNKADAICLATYGEAMHRFHGLIPPALEVL